MGQRNRMSPKQLDMMITYMEVHTNFAKGLITKLGPQGHDKYKEMWQELSHEMNTLGPAQKTDEQWQKTWTSLKNRAKALKADYTIAMKRTGNTEVTPLSDMVERISDIFGKYGSGLSVITEIGVDNTIFSDSDNDCFENVDLDNQNINYKDGPEVENYCQESLDYLMILIISLENDVEVTRIINILLAILNSLVKLLWICIAPESSSRNRPNAKQMALLVQTMVRNKDLASDTMDPLLAKHRWEELTDNLNAISNEGANDRDAESWQRTWIDKKRSVLDKKRDYEHGLEVQLETLDLKVINALGLHVDENRRSQALRDSPEPSCTDELDFNSTKGKKKGTNSKSKNTGAQKKLTREEVSSSAALAEHNAHVAAISESLKCVARNQLDQMRVMCENHRRTNDLLEDLNSILKNYFTGNPISSASKQVPPVEVLESDERVENVEHEPEQPMRSPSMYDPVIEVEEEEDMEEMEVLEDDIDFEEIMRHIKKSKK